MSREAPKSSSDKSEQKLQATLSVVKTLAGTTWRMFVPPALGAIVGLQLETQGTHRAAVWGAALGVVVSGLLVWQQYRAVNSKESK